MFNRYPLLWPLLAFVLGILLASFTPIDVALGTKSAIAIYAALVLLVLFLSFKKRLVLGFVLFFFSIGIGLTLLQNQQFEANHYAKFSGLKKHFFSGKIIAAPIRTAKAIKLEVALSHVDSTSVLGKIVLYTPQDSATLAALPGDKVLFYGKLQEINPPKNPYEFDYRNYLHLHQIYAQTYTTDYKIVSQPGFSLLRFGARARNRLLHIINQLPFSEEERSLAAALLVGYRHLISDDTQQAFAGAGAMHVLAVSGLHVGILYVITAFLLRINNKKPQRTKWYQTVGVIFIIWSYAVLTGLSPSVTRAAVMFSFITAGYLMKRKTATIQSVLVSMLFLLVLKPNYLFEVGFQLSYAALFGIVYMQPRIVKLLPKSNYRAIDWVWQITAVSIAAQLATFPFGLYYFHQFPVYFLVSNLLVIPAATLAMYYGLFLLIVLNFVEISGFVVYLAYPLKGIFWVMIEGVKAVQNLPYAVLEELYISRFELVILLVLVFSAADAFFKKRKRALAFGILALLVLVGTHASRQYQIGRQSKLTIYSIEKQVAVSAQTGRKGTLVASSHLLDDADAMLFYIKRNQWANGIISVEYLNVNRDTTTESAHIFSNYLALHQFRVLVLDGKPNEWPNALPVDLVFVKGRAIPPKADINKPIVLHNNLSAKSKAAWLAKYPNAHDLKTQGAFVLSD